MAQLFILLVYIFGFIGWVMNILKLFLENEETAITMLRVVGIFLPPIGAIFGYM